MEGRGGGEGEAGVGHYHENACQSNFDVALISLHSGTLLIPSTLLNR